MRATKSDFSAGLAAKFCGAFCDADGTPTELNALAEDEVALKDLIAQRRAAMASRRIWTASIHLNTPPSCPDGWTIESHKPMEVIEFDPDKIAIHLESDQLDGRAITGTDIRVRLAGKQVLNACFIDWAMMYKPSLPGHIMRDWQGSVYYLYAWGTIYRDSRDRLLVASMYWSGGQFGGGFWAREFRALQLNWHDRSPALILATD